MIVVVMTAADSGDGGSNSGVFRGGEVVVMWEVGMVGDFMFN